MSTLPLHMSFAVVDIETFGTRIDPDQRWLRGRMYDTLTSAADQAGMPWSQCHAVDRGDSVALLIEASVSKVTVAERFVRAMRSELRAHNRRSRSLAAMRMRMALHAGEVSWDGKNWIGTELNTACRLVDVPELRAVLRDTPTAQLALCVSDLWYQTVVRQIPDLVDHRTYTPIAVVVKELDTKAWLHIP